MVPIKVDALKTMRLKWGPWWPQPAWEENCLGLENPNSSLPCANQPAEGHLSFTCFRVFENNPNNHVGNVNKHRTVLVNVSFYRSYFKKVKKVIKKLLKKIKNCQRPQKATIKLQKIFFSNLNWASNLASTTRISLCPMENGNQLGFSYWYLQL